jgi:hypothetical protein
MPPEPPADPKLARPNQLADLEIKIDGKTVFEAEVAA